MQIAINYLPGRRRHEPLKSRVVPIPDVPHEERDSAYLAVSSRDASIPAGFGPRVFFYQGLGLMPCPPLCNS